MRERKKVKRISVLGDQCGNEKMVKRAAEIAAYRGDWLQTGGKIAENEQPGSQHSERMGSKTGGKIAKKPAARIAA